MPQLQIIVYFLLRVKEERGGVMGRLGKEDRRNGLAGKWVKRTSRKRG